MVQPTTLPFFRQKHTPPSLNVPRRYELSVKLVCLLSTVPALWHAIQNIKHIYSITPSISLQTSWTEYTVATLWCVLSAYWHWHLTTHLMQQWCYRLEIKQAFMRCLGFIGSMTLLSVTISLWCQDPIVTQLMICSVLLIISLPSFSTFLLWPLLTVMVISAILLSGKIQYDPYRLMELMPDQYALDQYPPTSSTAIVLILSSWSMEAAERRQLIRSQLPKDMQYRFVLGQPSQPKMAWMQPLLTTESDQFYDLLIVPAPDTHSSQKLLEAMRWTKSIEYEYLIKTEDDMFVRWDRVLDELQDDWRGFVYHNMPSDQDLPLLPDYTWGKFYWLSRKVVELLIYTDHPHRWTEKDDINLSLWLFGFNIKPVHDRRIQTADVCEDDLIAKQVALTDFKQTWTQMVEHVQTHQPICQGLALTRCALCYPCHGRSDDWRSQSVDCDPFRGVSPASLPYPKIPQVAEVKDQLSNGTDHWIIPNMLSTETSVYSNETHWHLLYWVCWTSEPSTFTDRHWRALELVWIHEPQAVIFMISNTLSQSFFQDYLDQGYQIQVVQFDKQRLLNWGWYFGSGTQDWLSGWEQWEKGKFFYWHLTDYIRCLLLYHYGGTYMDMDALWIRIPPDSQMEFIGSDYSQVHSDRAWTLDAEGLYLPQGLMRFKRGWKLFREMAEGAFSAFGYDPECFNCGGPKAITSYVRERRAVLEQAGLTILPREVLYPFHYLEIHKLLQPNPLAEQDLRTKIEPVSWNIHLFGKMTNHLPVQPQSMIDVVFQHFDLSIRTLPRLVSPADYVYQAVSDRMRQDDLRGPNLIRLHSVPGRFQGLNVVYLQGRLGLSQVRLEVETAIGRTRLMDLGYSKRVVWTGQVNLQEINHVLQTMQYIPTPLMLANGGRDRIKIKLSYTEANVTRTEEATISLTVLEPIEEDEPLETL